MESSTKLKPPERQQDISEDSSQFLQTNNECEHWCSVGDRTPWICENVNTPCVIRDNAVSNIMFDGDVPRKFWNKSFKKIELDGVPDQLKEAESGAKKWVSNNLMKKISKGQGLFFSGSVGTGKTTIMVCVARVCVLCGRKIFFVSSDSLDDKLMRLKAKSPADWATYEEAINKIPILLIDDLGYEKSKWVHDFLESVIGERYNNCLSTMVTSNMNFEGLKKKYSERMVDRLTSVDIMLTFEGKSLRKKGEIDD